MCIIGTRTNHHRCKIINLIIPYLKNEQRNSFIALENVSRAQIPRIEAEGGITEQPNLIRCQSNWEFKSSQRPSRPVLRKRRTVRERKAVNEDKAVIAKFDGIAVRPRDQLQERLAIAPHVFPEVFRRHPLSRRESVNRDLNEVAFLWESI